MVQAEPNSFSQSTQGDRTRFSMCVAIVGIGTQSFQRYQKDFASNSKSTPSPS
jgi:hypothetical protein